MFHASESPRHVLLVVIAIATLITMLNSTARGQEPEGFDGFTIGIRVNTVKGNVVHRTEGDEFELEPGLRLQVGDSVSTGPNAYAELLLQPGNYLRIGPESDLYVLSDAPDRMRLKLQRGAINIEIVGREGERLLPFYESLSQRYELIRIFTPGAALFVTQPGIFRLNVPNDSLTEVLVRKGEAVINGRQIKEKRRGIASREEVVVREFDPKVEDALDHWSRERAEQSVQANRSLRKDPAWAKGRKEEERASLNLPEGEKSEINPLVVSAKPAAIHFVESGAEFYRPESEWQPLTAKSQLESGDSVRTDEYGYVELTLLPDSYLRLDRRSEVRLENLTNEGVSVKLLRGSMILDIAKFERKNVLEISFGGPSTSVTIVDAGNYRVDAGPDGDQIKVRDGKVVYNHRSVGSCRRISNGTVDDCDKKRSDDFDFWSVHRGEGELFTTRGAMAATPYLLRLRRNRLRTTGFWFHHPGQDRHYIFVPYYSTNFRSPYGGKYSVILLPPRVRFYRVGKINHRDTAQQSRNQRLIPLRPSAYLCDLCIKKLFSTQRSQRYAEGRREELQPTLCQKNKILRSCFTESQRDEPELSSKVL